MTGAGQQKTIRSGETETAHITNTYDFAPGSLIVTKTIAGPAAGQQGEIRIHTVCDGTALTPDFVLDPRTPAGDHVKPYDNIPAPTTCTITETADGHTSAVSVVVDKREQTVHVGAGEIVNAGISDTYGLVPGELAVTKTITGPAAGSQGQVVIHTVCGSTALTPDFVIPAGTREGVQSLIYKGIPTPADCVVTETTDGHTSTVSVDVTGSPARPATIPGGGAGAATISDTYSFTFGSLLVRKTIAGPGAGEQG